MTKAADEARSSRPRVLLFSESYPAAGGHEPFLEAEVRELAPRIAIVVIPSVWSNGPATTLPDGVECEPGLARHLSSPRGRALGVVRAMFTGDTYRELRAFGARAFHPRIAAGVLVRGGRMIAARTWTRGYLRRSGKVIAYTWWSSASGYGVARAASEHGIACIARVHGYDLFPEQDRLGRIPFQRTTLDRFDAVYSVSRAGAEYLRQQYPQSTSRIRVAYLGTEGPAEPGLPSQDGVFRILSCSMAVPLKRLELLAAAVGCLLQDHPEVKFTWTHIGDGPTLATVRRMVQDKDGLAEHCTFLGNVTSADVRAFLASEPVDAFVNVSSSEGVPVALMEAASFGIPMIATDIRGNPEIVNHGNGRLIAAHPAPEDIARALMELRDLDASGRDLLRAAARATWQEHFSAAPNYAAFADVLCDLWYQTR